MIWPWAGATWPEPERTRRAQVGGTPRRRSWHVRVLVTWRVAARPPRARMPSVTSLRARSLQHVRPVVPLYFPSSEPESERMGQSGRHYRMCNALYEILRAAAGDEHTVSCDAFVYFDAANPERKLAPDGAVKLGVPQHDFDSWKSWERGTPELAFGGTPFPSDSPERWTFEEKLRRYRALGVGQLVVFHVDGEPGSRLRVWDRIDGNLVERTVTDERTPCLTLDAFLVITPVEISQHASGSPATPPDATSSPPLPKGGLFFFFFARPTRASARPSSGSRSSKRPRSR